MTTLIFISLSSSWSSASSHQSSSSFFYSESSVQSSASSSQSHLSLFNSELSVKLTMLSHYSSSSLEHFKFSIFSSRFNIWFMSYIVLIEQLFSVTSDSSFELQDIIFVSFLQSIKTSDIFLNDDRHRIFYEASQSIINIALNRNLRNAIIAQQNHSQNFLKINVWSQNELDMSTQSLFCFFLILRQWRW